MSNEMYTTTRELTRFLLRESDILRSMVFVYIVIASASRTAMIFLINEIAERGGPDLFMFGVLMAVTLVMLVTSHWAQMSGVVLVQSLTHKLRSRMSQQILDADVSFIQTRDHGEVYQASTTHINNVAGTPLRLVSILQAVLLLTFCLIYMAIQMPSSVLATLIALAVGVTTFFITEAPASRAIRASLNANAAYYSSIHDLLRGYKELRLRWSRRTDMAAKIKVQVDDSQRLSIIGERHFSYGQIGASGALAALLISIVVILPLISGADSVLMLQILTLVLFSFGPIEAMIGDLPTLSRAAVSFREFCALEDGLQNNAERHVDHAVVNNRAAFKTLEMRDITVHLSRDVGDDAKARDTFTLGPINMTLVPGQSVFITGGNGMGKSTLLQLLTGLRHPDSGQIILDGTPVTRENVSDYRGVFAAVFSEFYMFRYLYGLTEQERGRLAKNIEELGLSEGVSIQGDSFSNLSLSTGQMRRLALSIALAEERPILVLDEFAADQDPVRRAFFYDVLVPRLAKAGHCVVAVTHDEHCFGKCDRLIRMEDGKIISDTVQIPAVTTK